MPPRRSVLIFGLLVLMEVLAGFFPVAALTVPYSLFWLLLLCALAGLGVALLVAGLGPGEPWNRVGLLAGGAVSVGVPASLVGHTLPLFLFTAFLLALAFWRGVVVTREPPDYEQVQARFGLDFGLIFAGLVLVMARGLIYQRAVWGTLAVLGIAYVVVSMVAFGVARLEVTREPGAAQAVFLAIGAQLALLVVISFLALSLFTLDIAGWVGHLTQPLQDAMGRALTFVLTLIATPIAALIEHLHVHRAAHPARPAANPFASHPQPRKQPANRPAAWINVVALLVVVLIFAGLAGLIWRAMPRITRRQPEEKVREERQSLWSFREFWHNLLAWIRGLFRRGAEAAEGAVHRTRRRIWGEYPADPVRKLYAQLLRRAASFGLVRDPAVTPLEFQLALAAAWPEAARDFASLTDAYVLRRYGDVPFEPHEVAALQERWQRVRGLMRRPRVERQVPTEPAAQAPAVPPSAHQSRARDALLSAASYLRTAVKQLGAWLLLGILAPLIVLVIIVTVVILGGHV